MKKIYGTLLLIGGIAFGQNTPIDSIKQNDSINQLNEAVIIGKKEKMLPGSGEVITKKELEKLNQPDINKVLRTVPGVNVRDEEGFGLRPNIGLRGTAVNRSAKITIMEDGILMAPAAYADPSAYYFPTFARMESLEIIKGSSQIKYGPYTIGGVLNMVSSQIPDRFKAFGTVGYGNFNTNQQRIFIGDSSNPIDYAFEVNRLASNGFKELDNGGNTGFERRDFMGKLRWKTKEEAKIQQAFSLKFLTMTEKGNESYLGLTFEDFKNNPNRRYAATQKDNLDLSHEHLIFNHSILPFHNLSINTSAYYTKTFRDWGRVNSIGGQEVLNIIKDPLTHAVPYQIMTGQANGAVVFQNGARIFNTKGIQTNLKYNFETGKIKHELQLGLRYHEDKADRTATSSNFTMTNGTMLLTTAGIKGNAENEIRNAYAFAGYLQYDIKLHNLTISPGIRFENINLRLTKYGKNDYARQGTSLQLAGNDLSTVYLPGVGINYTLTNEMNFFGGVHKGFSPPGTPSETSTTQAEPENAINYELGYRIHKKGLKAQLVGFLNEYKNILGADTMAGGGMGTGDLFNAGQASVKGIEVGIDYDLMSNLNKDAKYKLPLGIAYTYTDARFNETFINGGGDWGKGQINADDFIPFITPHLLTASLGYENEKFDFTLIGRFVSETRTKPGQDDFIVPSDAITYNQVNSIDKYWVFDVSANYKFSENITLFTLINNVLNNEYIVANLPQGYRPGMPFASNLGLKWAF
jgi:Fe(3+) dicitrate transport protein